LQRMLKSGTRVFKGFLSDFEKRLKVVENKTGLKAQSWSGRAPSAPLERREEKVQGERERPRESRLDNLESFTKQRPS
jgi:hypothetical protein